MALTQFFARGARQVPDGGDWFEKTTTFADRENNDPLAPVRKELRAAKAPESKMVGVERESNNWYKNQEKKRSMFGRTLNPLTGYASACVHARRHCRCTFLVSRSLRRRKGEEVVSAGAKARK